MALCPRGGGLLPFVYGGGLYRRSSGPENLYCNPVYHRDGSGRFFCPGGRALPTGAGKDEKGRSRPVLEADLYDEYAAGDFSGYRVFGQPAVYVCGGEYDVRYHFYPVKRSIGCRIGVDSDFPAKKVPD